MKFITKTLLSELASLATVVGLVYSMSESKFSVLQWVLIVLSGVLFCLVIYFTISDYRSSKPKIFSSKKQIRDYMYEWISGSGRVAIFTRDLSWVEDDEMKVMLNNKAQKKELIICLPQKIDKVDEFQKNGALIIEYSKFNYTPKSRFTIVNFERDDSKVAVGKMLSDGKHSVEVYSNGEHPYFQVANDLVCILKNKPL